MRIKVVLISEKEGNVDQPKTESYWQIDSNDGTPLKIPYNDFSISYKKGLEKIKPLQDEIGVQSSPKEGALVQKTLYQDVDLTDSLNLLIKGLLKDSEKFLTNDEELVINSDSNEILELSWEQFVDRSKTVVFREVMTETPHSSSDGKKGNFLLLISHSYDNKTNISNGISEEVSLIYKEIVEVNKPDRRIEHLNLLKHPTKENITNIKWNNCTFVHLVMHGEDDGRLCLENDKNYEIIDHMSKDTFLDILKGQAVDNLFLVFLSFCYSGGKTTNSSLAFDLVKSGIAKYSLAYLGRVGNESARDFSQRFYNDFLTGQRDVSESFKNAFMAYSNRATQGLLYVPVLYTRYSDV